MKNVKLPIRQAGDETVRLHNPREIRLDAEETTVFVLVRALTYATLFVGIALIYVPARLLSNFSIVYPPGIGFAQVGGATVAAAGAMIALWCVLTFALSGKGTPAPFDPPRRLVAQGPYRFLRNPMYLGAALALVGAAAFYESLPLLGYAATFLIVAHFFVVLYEEPALRKAFGKEYEIYCRQVRRWLPRF